MEIHELQQLLSEMSLQEKIGHKEARDLTSLATN